MWEFGVGLLGWGVGKGGLEQEQEREEDEPF